MLIVLCLGLLVGGCCSGMCRKGFENALKYRDGEIRAYGFVETLSTLERSARNEYLRGFELAYRDVNDNMRGEEYSRILRDAAESGMYKQGFAQGQGHVSGRVTDAQIQTMIRNSLGQSRGYALGWRAGYISGYVHEMSVKNPRYDEGQLYDQAETMYNTLSPIQSSKENLGTISKILSLDIAMKRIMN